MAWSKAKPLSKKLSALQLAAGDAHLTAAVQRGKRLLHRRALMSGAAGALPLPGLDWVVDAALLSNLIPKINAEFGLAEQQIAALQPSKRERIQQAVSIVGTMLIGKFITKDLLMRAAKTIGVRLTAQQAVKIVPLAGQALSALISYSAIRYLGEQHMRDCVLVLLETKQT
jgi:uncharacterized protein (DUF697 family)